MTAHAPSDACLDRLVRMAGPLLRAAQRQCPRAGTGRTPDCHDWQIVVLMLVAILHRSKSESVQCRFLLQHRAALQQWLDLTDFPARSTCFARYRPAHRFFRQAIVEGCRPHHCGRSNGRRVLCPLIRRAGKPAVGRTPHRGLDNNHTQLLAAQVACQLLLRYNHRCSRQNDPIQRILDARQLSDSLDGAGTRLRGAGS